MEETHLEYDMTKYEQHYHYYNFDYILEKMKHDGQVNTQVITEDFLPYSEALKMREAITFNLKCRFNAKSDDSR